MASVRTDAGPSNLMGNFCNTIIFLEIVMQEESVIVRAGANLNDYTPKLMARGFVSNVTGIVKMTFLR